MNQDDYQILYFEIVNQYLTEALSIALMQDTGDIAAFYGNIAIEIINSREVSHNQNCVDELKKLFAEKVLSEFTA